MAIVTRYAAPTAAGAGDGSTPSDPFQLLPSGNWNTSYITNFDFSGSDSLLIRVLPGSYTCTQILAAGLFTNAPSVANLLHIEGVDSNGDPFEPPTYWSSAQPPTWNTGLPTIDFNGSFYFDLANSTIRFLKVTKTRTATTNAITVNNGRSVTWCDVFCNSGGTGAANVVTQVNSVENCLIGCSGNHTNLLSISSAASAFNCRLDGHNASGSGTLNGLALATTSGLRAASNCTTFRNTGVGIESGPTSDNGHNNRHYNCVAVEALIGFRTNSPSAPTGTLVGRNNVYADIEEYAIDVLGSARPIIANSIAINATSGFSNNWLNIPTYYQNEAISGENLADHFVDPTNRDYRIKFGSPYWGRNVGAGDEPLNPEVIAQAVWTREGRSLTA